MVDKQERCDWRRLAWHPGTVPLIGRLHVASRDISADWLAPRGTNVELHPLKHLAAGVVSFWSQRSGKNESKKHTQGRGVRDGNRI